MERRTAIVTGAASGLGRATAAALVEAGSSVCCLDVDEDALQFTVQDLSASGDVFASVCDVTDEADVELAVADVLARQGRIDQLANVAGIASYVRSEELTTREFDRVVAVDLRGPFLMIRACLPALVESKGAVVNVASTAAVAGWAYSAAYSAAKAGLVGLTRTLALEFGPRDVRFNCVSPGAIETPMAKDYPIVTDPDRRVLKRPTGLAGRQARPGEVAAAIVYLLSEQAEFITGSNLVIDGGATA